MKNTPIQKLILKLVDKKDEYEFNTDYENGVRRGLALAIVNARELLEEEKEQIETAFDYGVNVGLRGGLSKDAEQYFNETFEQ